MYDMYRQDNIFIFNQKIVSQTEVSLVDFYYQ